MLVTAAMDGGANNRWRTVSAEVAIASASSRAVFALSRGKQADIPGADALMNDDALWYQAHARGHALRGHPMLASSSGRSEEERLAGYLKHIQRLVQGPGKPTSGVADDTALEGGVFGVVSRAARELAVASRLPSPEEAALEAFREALADAGRLVRRGMAVHTALPEKEHLLRRLGEERAGPEALQDALEQVARAGRGHAGVARRRATCALVGALCAPQTRHAVVYLHAVRLLHLDAAANAAALRVQHERALLRGVAKSLGCANVRLGMGVAAAGDNAEKMDHALVAPLEEKLARLAFGTRRSKLERRVEGSRDVDDWTDDAVLLVVEFLTAALALAEEAMLPMVDPVVRSHDAPRDGRVALLQPRTHLRDRGFEPPPGDWVLRLQLRAPLAVRNREAQQQKTVGKRRAKDGLSNLLEAIDAAHSRGSERIQAADKEADESHARLAAEVEATGRALVQRLAPLVGMAPQAAQQQPAAAQEPAPELAPEPELESEPEPEGWAPAAKRARTAGPDRLALHLQKRALASQQRLRADEGQPKHPPAYAPSIYMLQQKCGRLAKMEAAVYKIGYRIEGAEARVKEFATSGGAFYWECVHEVRIASQEGHEELVEKMKSDADVKLYVEDVCSAAEAYVHETLQRYGGPFNKDLLREYELTGTEMFVFESEAQARGEGIVAMEEAVKRACAEFQGVREDVAGRG